MPRTWMILLALAPLGACASFARDETPAVVVSESARQAAAASARAGADPDEALARGEAAKEPN